MGTLTGILTALYVIAALSLIFIVLIQKGKGGGLAGVFGGGGGMSMFGVKAGDVLGKITAVAAVLFMLLAIGLCVLYNRNKGGVWSEKKPVGASTVPGLVPEGGEKPEIPEAPDVGTDAGGPGASLGIAPAEPGISPPEPGVASPEPKPDDTETKGADNATPEK